jgi:ribosomal protein L1
MGTLTDNVAAAIAELRQGRVEFKMDRTGIVHAPIGKASFDPQELFLNLGALTGARRWRRQQQYSSHTRRRSVSATVCGGSNLAPKFTCMFLSAGALLAVKPEAIKGGLVKFVRTAYLASTMGPSVPVDVASLVDAVSAAAAAVQRQKSAADVQR